MATEFPPGVDRGVRARPVAKRRGDLAEVLGSREVMTATVTGTIALISDNAESTKASAYEQVRAPSSVVEHVTFNHGVPGSIPGGPTIARAYSGETDVFPQSSQRR